MQLLRNNTENSSVPFSQFPLMVTLPSLQESLMLPLYSHIHFPPLLLPLEPLATTHLFSISIIFSSQELYKWTNTASILLSFFFFYSAYFSRDSSWSLTILIFFLFLAEQYSMRQFYYNLFYQLPTEGYLGHFQFLSNE